MNTKLAQIGVLVLAVATTSPAFAASNCPTLAEAGAERVRVLQTEFMVAALKCRARPELQLYDKYNSFVRKFTPQLLDYSKSLTGYFSRRYGITYRQYMDKYITSLANTLSTASDADPSYCNNTSAKADLILSGDVNTVSLASVKPQNPQAATLSQCLPDIDTTTLTADNTPIVPAK